MSSSAKPNKEPKQYLQNIPRRWVYGGLVVLALIAGLLFISVPHYKPLKLASMQEIQDAHHDIIKQYFVPATTCKNDNLDKTDRIKAFNKYFQVNKYGNRAVLRGCHDADQLLAKDDDGKWRKVDITVELDGGLPDSVNNACLTQDIIKHNNPGFTDPGVREIQVPQYQKICEHLAKQSYIEVHWNRSVRFHF